MDNIILDNVTIVSVTSVRVHRSLNALKYSMKNIKFGNAKLLTDANISDNEIEIINIDKLDYEGYSKFIVYELHKYIDTSHVLIIQDDGFIVNPHMWDNEFLKYDYIGSPFPIPKENDNISYRDPFGNLQRVGNGGFSLRSKKLLSLPSQLNLEWKPYFGFYNEDGFFAVHNRHILESHGCVFSPIDIASRFSKEYETPENVGIIPFGFHGKHNDYCQLI